MENNRKPPNTISDRIKELMDVHELKAYKVCKDTSIPEGTFSRSIKTPDTWKIQHLKKLSEYFMVSIDYLVTGNTKHIDDKLKNELYVLKNEVILLRDKVATYEIAAKSIINESKKTKEKTK